MKILTNKFLIKIKPNKIKIKGNISWGVLTITMKGNISWGVLTITIKGNISWGVLTWSEQESYQAKASIR